MVGRGGLTDTEKGISPPQAVGVQPVRFVWREVTYSGRVVNSWKLSDRTYYRLVTRDHQAFDLYRDDAKDGLWILANIHD